MGQCITAIVTPRKENNNIDFDSFRNLCEFQNQQGISSLVVGGSTGEGELLTEFQRVNLIKIAVKYGFHVIAGVGGKTTEEAVRNAKIARDLGAQAALVAPIGYIRPTRDGLMRYYRKVTAILPTIVYNIPKRTGRNITVDEQKDLLKFEKVFGIKEASGDMEQINKMLQFRGVYKPRQNPPTWKLYSGDDSNAFEICKNGGNGVISVLSNAFPDIMSDIVSDDLDLAKKTAQEAEPLIEAASVENNPAAIKHILYRLGIIKTDKNHPDIGQLSQDGKMKIAQIIAYCLPQPIH